MSDSNQMQQKFTETIRKWKKRPHGPILNGDRSYEDNDKKLHCSVCLEMLSDPHMTKCGHTFCLECIKTSLKYSKKCPKCTSCVETISDTFPNNLLAELITSHKLICQDNKRRKLSQTLKNSNSLNELHAFLAKEKPNFTISEVNSMLEILSQKKQQLEANCRETQILVLKEFLQKVRARKQEELKQIQQQLRILDADVVVAEEMYKAHMIMHPSLPSSSTSTAIKPEPSTSAGFSHNSHAKHETFNGSKYVNKVLITPPIVNRRKRMIEHFDDLEKTYLDLRCRDITLSNCIGDITGLGLNEFDQTLSKITRFTSARSLATLTYSNDAYNTSNIVSSIEFEKDNEYFAIAGVTKKIKVFEFASVIHNNNYALQYPATEMQCNSKISCISWSSFQQSMLASSDYEGTVTLWDAFTSKKVTMLQEHEKRCWSVDFNKVDSNIIASGSDDSKVKLWTTNMENSFATLEAKANVCCVKFSPDSRYGLAFGSADHCVHYYDLRNTLQPLEVLRGHKKAVSYVKFLNGKEIVSASTDSQLKLWNVNQSYSLRSFKGHQNEKNFVGLATDGDFVACGSENNSLYVYYKGLSSHVMTFRFEACRSILEKDRKEEESNEFVSAVCWRMGTNVVVAANSQGNIKILELL